jgi:ribosomal-protein-alanine N-acetyltransferase
MKIEDVFSDQPILETDSLILRKLTLDDAEDLFEYAAHPEVTRYLQWEPHESISDSITFIQTAIIRYERQLPAPWGIELKTDRKIIGSCDFISWFPDHFRAEIGYALARKYWGYSYMTEAVRKIIDFGFMTSMLNRIQAMCEPDNLASARVMEKVGMTYEGILRGFHFQNGACQDMKIYSILESEWISNQ